VETLLEDIFELVSANKSNLMLVTENGQHIGVLDTENLLEFLLIKGKIKKPMSASKKATHPDRIELVYSGEDYFSLEQIIQNVQYEIHLQFYIFFDTTGSNIVAKLKEAAARVVYILLDGFGSFSFLSSRCMGEVEFTFAISLRSFRQTLLHWPKTPS
jgi:hypothetical protein